MFSKNILFFVITTFAIIAFLAILSLLYFLIMLNHKFFYRHRVLDNQRIKLIQENHNLNSNYIIQTEPVNCFNLFHLVVMSNQSTISNQSTGSTNFQKPVYFAVSRPVSTAIIFSDTAIAFWWNSAICSCILAALYNHCIILPLKNTAVIAGYFS